MLAVRQAGEPWSFVRAEPQQTPLNWVLRPKITWHAESFHDQNQCNGKVWNGMAEAPMKQLSPSVVKAATQRRQHVCLRSRGLVRMMTHGGALKHTVKVPDGNS
jgi:hypothetical protein